MFPEVVAEIFTTTASKSKVIIPEVEAFKSMLFACIDWVLFIMAPVDTVNFSSCGKVTYTSEERGDFI